MLIQIAGRHMGLPPPQVVAKIIWDSRRQQDLAGKATE